MHYILECDIVYIGSRYFYLQSATVSSPFAQGLATFSDMILPFMLLVSMLIVSSRFILILFF